MYVKFSFDVVDLKFWILQLNKARSNDPLKSTSVDLPRLTVSFHKDGGLQRNGFLYTFLLLSASVLPLFLTDSSVLQKPFVAFAVSVFWIGEYDMIHGSQISF